MAHTTITLYAVRHKPTGFYIPRPQRTDGRGGSFTEPFNFADPTSNGKSRRTANNAQPRFFTEERAAKIFLNAWLQGRWKCHRGGEWDDYYEETYPVKDPNRIAGDMEIVPVQITLP